MGMGKSSSGSKSKGFGFTNSDNIDVSNKFGSSFQNGISQSGSYVDPSQNPYLRTLYGNAQDVYNRAPDPTRVAQGVVNPLMSGGMTAFRNLGALTDPTKQIAAQTASLKSGLGDLFAQGRAGVNDAATRAGAFGGSRHGIEQAVLEGEIAKAFTQGHGDIVANANQQAASAAAAMGPMGGQLAQLGLTPESLRFSNLSQLGGLLGDPTILSRATSANNGGSFDLGSSFGAGKSRAYTQNKSKSKGKEASLDLPSSWFG